MNRRTAKYHPERKVDFYKILSDDVHHYLSQQKNGRFANNYMTGKIIFCLTAYFFTLSQYLSTHSTYASWLLWCFALGISSMLVGVNIGHDAVHNCIFRKQWINRLAGFSFDLIGVSSFTWKIKHNLVHHQFPNVTEVDYDIEAGPVLRFSPSEPVRWFHCYQHWYAPFIYMLFSLHLLFLNDFKVIKEFRQGNKNVQPNYWIAILPAKLLYLLLMIALPLYLLPYAWWQILAGFLMMHFTLSLFLALLLLPSHLFEQTSFSSVTEGSIAEDWTLHQLNTTLDFAQQSHLAHFLFGGFNTNAIHHLFPNICHCHYRSLSKILQSRTTAANIVYHHTSLFDAVRSHFRALKKLSTYHQAA